MLGKTVFVQDNDRDRAARTERMAFFKQLGLTVVPARDFDLSLERCVRKNFDLVVVHEGQSREKAMAMCDQLLEVKPSQPLLLVATAPVDRPYAVGAELDAVEARIRQIFSRATQEEEDLVAA